MDYSKMAEQIKAKLDSGETLEDSLRQLLDKPETQKRPRLSDRVEYIRNLSDLQALRKAAKSAFAKRSKAADPDTVSKYTLELDTAHERLDQLKATIMSSADPLKTSVEFKETPSGVIQVLISLYDTEQITTRIQKNTRLTKGQLHERLKLLNPNTIPEEISTRLAELGEQYLAAYVERLSRGDQRLASLNRLIKFDKDNHEPYIPNVSMKPTATKRKKSK